MKLSKIVFIHSFTGVVAIDRIRDNLVGENNQNIKHQILQYKKTDDRKI